MPSEETRHRLASGHLANERDIWIRQPVDGRTAGTLLVFLDAEFHRERMGSPAITAELQASGDLGPALCVDVSCGSLEARWVECPCHAPFARFLIDEFMPWLVARHPEAACCGERVLIGLSYTGLAASHVAHQPDHPFTTVISQSGSYWHGDGQLARDYAARPAARPARHFLTVGRRETQTNVQHREDVLQRIAQIDGVRAFRDVLVSHGHAVEYREFDGAHEFDWWRRMLPEALRWAATPPPAANP
jgi:enterochelin esterase family protein